MKKIAICGYSSSVGKYFIEKYKNEFEYVLLGRKNPDIFLDLKVRQLNGDTRMIENADALINFSAQTDDKSYDDINDMMQTNVLGPVFLAESARKYNIKKVIHISSISATYSENDHYYGYYAYSKKSADELLKLYCKRNNINYCIFRPSALFGTEDFAKHQALLYGIIHNVKNEKDVIIYGSRDSRRNYIHVSTLCEVIHNAIDSDVTGTFNVINLENSRLSEIVECLNDHYNKNSAVVFLKDKPDVQELILEDDGKIYELLGIESPNGFNAELMKGE